MFNRMFAFMYRRTIVVDVVQGIIVGGLLAGNSAERHDADILAEQLGARYRPRACVQ
jgi:hypothetical protein